jgi:hypothetical protein
MRGYHIHPNYSKKHTDTVEVASSNLAMSTVKNRGVPAMLQPLCIASHLQTAYFI